MATLNVYLADALKAEMESIEGVNWSQIAQEAIRAELVKARVMNAAQNDLTAVAARLKSTPSSQSAGFEAGVEWARQDATAEELEILESWDWDNEMEKIGRHTSGKALAAEAARQLFEDEWNYPDVLDLMKGRVTERRLEGFVEGAMSVWKAAKKLM